MLKAAVEACSECPLGTTRGGPCPFTPRRVQAQSVVCPQGEVARNILFIREGAVALSGLGSDGTERSLGIRGPRSVLCWEAFQNAASPVEIRTLTDSRVCAMPVADVAAWVGPEGSPARTLLTLLVDELLRRDEEAEARRGETLSRVARFLLSWSTGPDTRLRKQVIARALGMRPETFSRALTKLSDQGLIARGTTLRVLDRPGLEAMAGAEERLNETEALAG
jgi:CRP/FNR family transcriptional regulator, cyclic AMP receptor protein